MWKILFLMAGLLAWLGTAGCARQEEGLCWETQEDGSWGEVSCSAGATPSENDPPPPSPQQVRDAKKALIVQQQDIDISIAAFKEGMSILLFDPKDGFYTKRGKAAMDASDRLEGYIQEIRDRCEAPLKDNWQRVEYGLVVDKIGREAVWQSAGYVAQEREVWLTLEAKRRGLVPKSSLDEWIGLAQEDAPNPNTDKEGLPPALDRFLKMMDKHIDLLKKERQLP